MQMQKLTQTHQKVSTFDESCDFHLILLKLNCALDMFLFKVIVFSISYLVSLVHRPT